MHQRAAHLLPPAAWQHLSPPLYMAFWALALYDVDVPESLYLEEIRRLEQLVRLLVGGGVGPFLGRGVVCICGAGFCSVVRLPCLPSCFNDGRPTHPT